MKKTKQQVPELSEERAAQILKNVFEACGVPENKTPLHDLRMRYEKRREMMERKEEAMSVQRERRKIGRVKYSAKAVVVVCDTQEKISANVENASPMGLGITMERDSPDILGRDVIIVTETMIMYADVTRQERQEDGSYRAGITARKFTDDVLQYLFDNIALKENEEGEKETT